VNSHFVNRFPNRLDHNIGGYIWENDAEQKIELTKKKAGGLTTSYFRQCNQRYEAVSTIANELKTKLHAIEKELKST